MGIDDDKLWKESLEEDDDDPTRQQDMSKEMGKRAFEDRAKEIREARRPSNATVNDSNPVSLRQTVNEVPIRSRGNSVHELPENLIRRLQQPDEASPERIQVGVKSNQVLAAALEEDEDDDTDEGDRPTEIMELDGETILEEPAPAISGPIIEEGEIDPSKALPLINETSFALLSRKAKEGWRKLIKKRLTQAEVDAERKRRHIEMIDNVGLRDLVNFLLDAGEWKEEWGEKPTAKQIHTERQGLEYEIQSTKYSGPFVASVMRLFKRFKNSPFDRVLSEDDARITNLKDNRFILNLLNGAGVQIVVKTDKVGNFKGLELMEWTGE